MVVSTDQVVLSVLGGDIAEATVGAELSSVVLAHALGAYVSEVFIVGDRVAKDDSDLATMFGFHAEAGGSWSADYVWKVGRTYSVLGDLADRFSGVAGAVKVGPTLWKASDDRRAEMLETLAHAEVGGLSAIDAADFVASFKTPRSETAASVVETSVDVDASLDTEAVHAALVAAVKAVGALSVSAPLAVDVKAVTEAALSLADIVSACQAAMTVAIHA